MPFSRRSKIKELWKHPVGRDLIQNMLWRLGRNERWPKNPMVAGLPLASLDRIAGSGFADMVAEMANREGDVTPPKPSRRAAWWKKAVVYQIYVPSFMDSDHDGVGDLAGVVQRLPYLESLGVDTLWLWPVLDAPGAGLRGVRDFYAINEDLGTMADMERLLDDAHGRGMKVMIGLDICATSDEHPWFKRAVDGDGGRDYYFFREGSADMPPNNWDLTERGSAWTWYPEMRAWGLNGSARGRMDLNWDNAKVREEMAKALRFWLDKGVDGFVFGSVNMISKENLDDASESPARLGDCCGFEKYTNVPRVHRHLRELRAALSEGNGEKVVPVFLGGEVQGIGPELAKFYTGEGRQELDMITDPAPLRVCGDGTLSLERLKRYYLRWMEQYGGERWMSLFLESPETPRMVSRLGASGLYRTILAKLLGTMLMTLRGTPIIYQGEELGLGNTRFASAEELRDTASLDRYKTLCAKLGDNAEALQTVLRTSPDHAHTPMPWNTSPKAGFTGAEPWIRLTDGIEYLNAAVQISDNNSVWVHYRKLIELRKTYSCLVNGSFNPVFKNNRNLFCYFRILENQKWYVELNISERKVARPGRILPSQQLMLSNYEGTCGHLRPYEANLYRCD